VGTFGDEAPPVASGAGLPFPGGLGWGISELASVRCCLSGLGTLFPVHLWFSRTAYLRFLGIRWQPVSCSFGPVGGLSGWVGLLVVITPEGTPPSDTNHPPTTKGPHQPPPNPSNRKPSTKPGQLHPGRAQSPQLCIRRCANQRIGTKTDNQRPAPNVTKSMRISSNWYHQIAKENRPELSSTKSPRQRMSRPIRTSTVLVPLNKAASMGHPQPLPSDQSIISRS